MKHSNISIFVSHVGCPNKCAFCNQHTISGQTTPPTADDVRIICSTALLEIKDKSNCEIAFFGGSFTAIDRDYMISLLESARGFVGKDMFSGIRISTRPDCVDEEILATLKNYGVTAIELGAQSMCDRVLSLNDRGHKADDVKKASKLVKSFGFELGLQMMTGLYGSDISTDYETALEILKLEPDTVRIYPTVILENTRLAQLYKDGSYKLYPFEDAVKLCSELLVMFEEKGVKVIKLGLHASQIVEGEMIGGYYHPAFRELCEGEIFKKKISKIIGFDESNEENFPCKNVIIAVNPKNLSKALGHRRCNVLYYEKYGVKLQVKADNNLDENIRIIEMK